MALDKFVVVKVASLGSNKSGVVPFEPTDDSAPEVLAAHQVLGVTMSSTSTFGDQVAVMRRGYFRGLVAGDFHASTLPTAGDRLWCEGAGRVTHVRPAGSGAQVFVGTFLGSGIADVNVTVLPSIGELSFVKRETPAEFDVLIWDPGEGAFVPRRLDHSADLDGLDQDDHHEYGPRRWSWMMGD